MANTDQSKDDHGEEKLADFYNLGLVGNFGDLKIGSRSDPGARRRWFALVPDPTLGLGGSGREALCRVEVGIRFHRQTLRRVLGLGAVWSLIPDPVG
ncbi:hypothetical protein U1Q18_031350 [Sarracenia purpurea var. burkii]